tara:strand:+ start:229 stop:861 length:633 start_codon:yes stop_codon:yes gene_type:complete
MSTSNIAHDYTIKNNTVFPKERNGRRSGARASSVSFELVSNLKNEYTFGNENTGQIAITNADGVTKTFIFISSGAGSKATGSLDSGGKIRINIFSVTGHANFATELVNAVNHENGFQGSMVATKDSSNASIVILTQVKVGSSGNKTINWNAYPPGMTGNGNAFGSFPESFTGGLDGEPISPFRISTTGAPNIRGQSLVNHYETFVGEQRT